MLVSLLESYHLYHAGLEAKKIRRKKTKATVSGSPDSSPNKPPGHLWWRTSAAEMERRSPPSPEEKRLTQTKAERLSFKRWRKASEDLPMHILSEEVCYLEDDKARDVMLELSGKG